MEATDSNEEQNDPASLPREIERSRSLPSPTSIVSVRRIFTDGLSVHTGTKSHVGVYSVWIDEDHPDNNAWWTKEGAITNQSMELAGVNAGLNVISRMNALSENDNFVRHSINDSDIPSQTLSKRSRTRHILYSTSHYVMNCMTKWLPRWERTGWITKQNRTVHNGTMLKNMADMARENNVEFVRVPPELLNVNIAGGSPSSSLVDPHVFVCPPRVPVHDSDAETNNVFDESVISGMKKARRSLTSAANDGTHSGCMKQRGAVTCEWSGG